MRTIVVLALLALVATACGSRLSDEQLAQARQVSAGGTADGGTTGGSVLPGDQTGTDGGTTGGGDATAGGGTAGGGTASGGTTGGGTAGGGTTAGSSCAGVGSKEVGISGSQLTLGNVSQLSGVIQGFARTAVGGANAYVAFANSQGGICGLQVTLTVADDRFDAAENRAQYARLADEVFAFVGGLSVVDNGGVSVLKGTNISDVGLGLSDEKLVLENSFSPIPIPPAGNSNNAEGYARWLKANRGIKHYALIWPQQATARNRAFGYRGDYTRAGLDKAYEAEVQVTETNYQPHAAAICENDPEHTVLTTALEVSGMANLAKALKQQGCQPKISHFGAQAYGQKFITLAGDAAEGVRIVLQFDIVEGTTNPLIKQFASWYERVNPGLDPDFFAVQSWISGHMLATAMGKVTGKLTRDAVFAQLEKLTNWDADGMMAPISPGKKIGPRCFLIAVVKGGHWQRETPKSGFIC